MAILIISGSLFSDWQSILDEHLPTESLNRELQGSLSALTTEIFHEQMPGTDQMEWEPLDPDGIYDQQAEQLLGSVDENLLFSWADQNSSLTLDLWRKASKRTCFIMFYCSPEYALARYLENHTFDTPTIKTVIDAWIIRTRAMLAFFMKHRNICLLIDIHTANKNPDALVRLINQAFETTLISPDNNSCHSSEVSILHRYFAASLLANNGTASELFDEVMSTATMLDDRTPVLISDIHQRLGSMAPEFLATASEAAHLHKALKQVTEDLRMMELQLHQTQKELEFYYLKERDTAILNKKYTEFLEQNPVLKLARAVRTSKQPE